MNKKNTQRKKRLGGKVIVFSVVFLGVMGYSLFNYVLKQENTEAYDYAFTKHGELFLITPETNDTIASIDIEIADNESTREMGLMYRQVMPENMGMLFVFDREEMRSFWMKNTYIALDLIFINSDYEIVTIRENNEPLIEWSIQSDAPARYVLEVNAGYCYEHGIKEGQRIQYNRKVNE